jgi:hypothetical protein
MKRACHSCLAHEQRREAEFVAYDKDGMAWFECSAHSDVDNVGGVTRVRREPIADFFARAGIPFEQLEDL